ncbi:MAG: hypothetical protein MPI95_02285, partial [Nitrosopumilus sp.]|nr:hypothetical protein [Nitrosopumilus sp.]
MRWTIDNSKIKKKLKDNRGNTEIQRGYTGFVDDIARLGDGDPASIGIRKKWMGPNFYGYEATPSIRVIYRIYYKDDLVVVTNIG